MVAGIPGIISSYLLFDCLNITLPFIWMWSVYFLSLFVPVQLSKEHGRLRRTWSATMDADWKQANKQIN